MRKAGWQIFLAAVFTAQVIGHSAFIIFEVKII